MDLGLTPEQHALRTAASAFAESLRPLLEADDEWRRQGMLSDGDSRAVTRALGEAGWVGLTWPEELGGRGRSHVDTALCAGSGSGLMAPGGFSGCPLTTCTVPR